MVPARKMPVAAKARKIEFQLWLRLRHQRPFYSLVLQAMLLMIVLRSVLPYEQKRNRLMKRAAILK